jgi:hypothetical protein
VINAVLITFFLFLLVFLIALAGISLCGEVTCVSQVQRGSGVVIAMICSLGALDHQRRDLHLIKLLYFTEALPSVRGDETRGGGEGRGGQGDRVVQAAGWVGAGAAGAELVLTIGSTGLPISPTYIYIYIYIYIYSVFIYNTWVHTI